MKGIESGERRAPSRREFVALGLGTFVVAITPGFLRRRPGLVRRSVPTMGTVAELAVVHRQAAYAQAAIDAAIAELRAVESTMTWFRPDSDVGRVNAEALARPVPVSVETAHVIRQALDWAWATDGAFDPCLGRAMAVWDFARRRTPPDAEALRSLAGRRLYRRLELDEAAGAPVVRFHDPDVSIDLGGIAKGYGVDRAVEALRSFGIYDALVNVGGDLYALGHAPDGGPWRIGIRSPADPGRLLETVGVADAAIATSGDYLQGFRHRGRRYHHLLDPATGGPRRCEIRSLTVRAASCLTADAAATAAFGMPAGPATRLLQRQAPDARIVRAV